MRFGLRASAVVLASACAYGVLGFPLAPAHADAQGNERLSDDQIKKILIEESIAGYSGSCPCPYSTARNGSRCGKRSAYSRPGGAAPLCYPKDVTAEMVAEYREGHPGG